MFVILLLLPVTKLLSCRIANTYLSFFHTHLFSPLPPLPLQPPLSFAFLYTCHHFRKHFHELFISRLRRAVSVFASASAFASATAFTFASKSIPTSDFASASASAFGRFLGSTTDVRMRAQRFTFFAARDSPDVESVKFHA